MVLYSQLVWWFGFILCLFHRISMGNNPIMSMTLIFIKVWFQWVSGEHRWGRGALRCDWLLGTPWTTDTEKHGADKMSAAPSLSGRPLIQLPPPQRQSQEYKEVKSHSRRHWCKGWGDILFFENFLVNFSLAVWCLLGAGVLSSFWRSLTLWLGSCSGY